MAISFCIFLFLLLLPLCFFGCYSSISSTLSVLVLSISFPFIFSKIKQFFEASSVDESTPEFKMGLLTSPEGEGNEFQTNETVLTRGECSSLENGSFIVKNSTMNVESDNGCCGPSGISYCSTTVDETSTEIACSDCLISDDEGLIEITLKEEPNNYLFHHQSTEVCLDESDDSVFMKYGLMDLMSEINEEDNLIEIDITMGSIKCSRLEIKEGIK